MFSERFSAAINRGEYLASDEKNFKTRCKSNPLVSMVREKANAVVGIWFFEIACFLNHKAYLIATRPAKALRKDKGLEIWAEWVAHFLPAVHELPSSSSSPKSKSVLGLNVCDSLYGSGGSAACFDEKKIPFLIGVRRGVFPHVEEKLCRAVKNEGQFAVAWLHKLGRAIICVWPSEGNGRKFCFTNAYQVVPQLEKIKTAVLDQEQLVTYVTTGTRPPNFTPNFDPAVIRPNPPSLLLPSPPPIPPCTPSNTLPNSPVALPNRVYEVICPYCPCAKRFWVKIANKEAKVHISIPIARPSKRRKKKEEGVGMEVEEGEGEGKGEGEEKEKEEEKGEGEEMVLEEGVGMEVEEVEGGGEGEEEEEKEEVEEKGKEKEEEQEVKKKKVVYSKSCGLLNTWVPEPYLDYSTSYQACDDFNSYIHHHQWQYRRQGSNSTEAWEKEGVMGEKEGGKPKGWQLVVDTFYFTCAITNAWVLYTSLHPESKNETFKSFSLALVDEMIEAVVNNEVYNYFL